MTNEATDFEITLYGFRDSDHVVDWLKDCRRAGEAVTKRHRPPDGLLTASEAAAKLGCSIKTLNGHVAAGDIDYVTIGRGSKRPRKRFTPADLDAFVAARTRKDSPCLSTGQTTRHISSTTSGSNVTAFTARPNARTSGKRKQ